MNDMNITWRRTSNISEEEIAAAESWYGINLPADIKKIFMQFNNGRPSICLFDSPKAKEHVIKKLLSFKRDDLENIYKAKDILDNEDKTLFPLANDPSGNLICLSGNKVVYWHHETGEVEFLANSFTEFLNNLY